MEDRQIIELYHARSETAIQCTAEKYGPYCHSIADHILDNPQDSEECVNDTWLRAWNSMPPKRPDRLRAFLGKITRNLALDRYRFSSRAKRGGSQTELVLEELEECVAFAAGNQVEQAVEERLLTEVLNEFLAGLPLRTRTLFVRRYWYLSSVREIAADLSMSESNVRITLHRTREKLRAVLEAEWKGNTI